MNSNIDQRKSNWSMVYIILMGSIICFAGVFMISGFDEESVRLNIRLSARFSITCFCLAFGASAINLFLRNGLSSWLIQNRKYLGVSFALIHLIHLMFLVILHQCFFPVFLEDPVFAVALGGLAYVFVVLMLLTSFEVFSKLISKANWVRLHTIGGYWILIVFSNSMLGRVAGGNMAYVPWGILVIAVWFMRLVAWRKESRG